MYLSIHLYQKGFSKEEWKAMAYELRWDKYKKAYDDSLELINETNLNLIELDSLIYSTEYCTEGGLSLDDVDLFSRLRSLTLCKGIVWPEKLWLYMKNLSEASDICLYDWIQC